MSRDIIPRNAISYCCNLDVWSAVEWRDYAILAEKAGFTAVWASDHFHPWFHTRAYESQTWVWMASLLERTDHVPVGTAITAPILRYHPAIVAQAFATMEQMYGRRVFITVGSGEAMNEVPLGYAWPGLKERRERVIEAVRIMRKLWTEEFVNFNGKYFTLKGANLYMKGSVPIFIAASGPKMAEAVGEYGDGFLTIKSMDYSKSELFPALDKGARKAGRTIKDIPKVLELDVSYDEDHERAIAPLRTQGGPLLSEMFIDPIYDPREIERRGRSVSDEELTKAYVVAATPEDVIKPIEAAFQSGFDHVYISSLSPDEPAFIEMCRKHVVPHFSDGKS